jgi:hypothetical protein
MTRHDDQFLRRAFDTAYDFELEDVKRGFQRIPRRTRWLTLSAFAFLVLVWVILQFVAVGLDAVERRNAPTAADHLVAPYGLAESALVADANALPALDGYSAEMIGLDTVNTLVTCMAQPDLCPAPADAEANASGDSATIEPAPLAVNSAAVNYTDAIGSVHRLVTLDFASPDDTDRALGLLFNHSREIGSIGNYVLSSSQPVRYYYSAVDGLVNFTWAEGDSLHILSSSSWRQLEDFMEVLR